jgi:phosphatidylserine synthase
MEFSKKIYDKIRNPFVEICVLNRITANEVTIFNHALTLTVGCFLFSRGTYWGNIGGLVICLINGFLDYLDGDIAKSTGTTSKFGVWLDSGFDVFIQNAVMGAIAIGCYKMGLPILWVVLFFLANAGSNLVSFHFNATFGFESANGNELFRKIMETKKDLHNRFLKNLVDPTSSVAGLMFFTFRYWIVAGIIFNFMPLAFIIMTSINSAKWFILFVIYGLHQKEDKRFFVLQALAALDDEREERYALQYSRKI